jgi:hypothetical protein
LELQQQLSAAEHAAEGSGGGAQQPSAAEQQQQQQPGDGSLERRSGPAPSALISLQALQDVAGGADTGDGGGAAANDVVQAATQHSASNRLPMELAALLPTALYALPQQPQRAEVGPAGGGSADVAAPGGETSLQLTSSIFLLLDALEQEKRELVAALNSKQVWAGRQACCERAAGFEVIFVTVAGRGSILPRTADCLDHLRCSACLIACGWRLPGHTLGGWEADQPDSTLLSPACATSRCLLQEEVEEQDKILQQLEQRVITQQRRLELIAQQQQQQQQQLESGASAVG